MINARSLGRPEPHYFLFLPFFGIIWLLLFFTSCCLCVLLFMVQWTLLRPSTSRSFTFSAGIWIIWIFSFFCPSCFEFIFILKVSNHAIFIHDSRFQRNKRLSSSKFSLNTIISPNFFLIFSFHLYNVMVIDSNFIFMMIYFANFKLGCIKRGYIIRFFPNTDIWNGMQIFIRKVKLALNHVL